MHITTTEAPMNPTNRPWHDWHWIECDRPDCPGDGVRHVAEPGWERPRWLCERHARETEAVRASGRD